MTLHLLHLPIRMRGLMAHGRAHGQVDARRSAELGYLVHGLLAHLFPAAPKPFDLGAGAAEPARDDTLSVLAYAPAPLAVLRPAAEARATAEALGAIAWDRAASKPMPGFAAGQRIGFRVRVCPTIRVGRQHPCLAHGAEVDPFLADRLRGPEPGAGPTREEVYRAWLAARCGDGITLESARLVAQRDARLWRKGTPRPGPAQVMHRHARPHHGPRHLIGRREAVFQGTLRVVEPESFAALLARGIGRHRAFGFGMMLLLPPPRDGC